MTDTNDSKGRSGFGAFLVGLIKFVLLVAVVACGVVLGLYAQNQFTYLSGLVNEQQNRIELLQAEIVRESDVERMILMNNADMRGELNDVRSTVITLENTADQLSGGVTALQATAETQGQHISALMDMQETLSGTVAANTEDLTALSATTDNLQRDLNAAGQAIVDLSQQLSTVSMEVSALGTQISRTAVLTGSTTVTETAEVAEETPAEETVEETPAAPAVEAVSTAELDAMRVWALVTSAQLSIADNRLNAAAETLTAAQTLIAQLDESVYGPIGETVDLALIDLSDKPAEAYLSLSDARTALDAMIGEMVSAEPEG